MFYEIAQSVLTVAAEVTVIAGLVGIVAHAIYTSHKNFMTKFCPPVAPYQPEAQTEKVTAKQPATQPETKPEAIPATDATLASLKRTAKSRKPRSKKATQPKRQPVYAGAAPVDYR